MQISLAGSGNANDGVGLLKQLAFGIHDGFCVRKELGEALVDAVVMGDNDAPPTHPRQCAVEGWMIDIESSSKRRPGQGTQFIDHIAEGARLDASVFRPDAGVSLSQTGKRHYGVVASQQSLDGDLRRCLEIAYELEM